MATASTSQEKARIAGLYSLLQVDPNDPYRLWWNKKISRSARLVFLKASSLPNYYATRSWDELGPDTRGRIRSAFESFEEWFSGIPKPERNGEAH